MTDAVIQVPVSGKTGVFSTFERMVAWRYLRARRAESPIFSIIAIFSIVGIALGVATLIIVLSVMHGFRDELLGKILGLYGHVTVQGAQEGIPAFDDLAKKLRAIPGVTHVSPIVDGQVLASSRGGSTGALVRGLRANDLAALPAVSNTLFSDARTDDFLIDPKTMQPKGLNENAPAQSAAQKILAQFAGENAVIIGADMAEHLGLRVGDAIKLTSPNGAQTPFGSTPRSKAYKIVGLFRMGMGQYDSGIIFLPLEEAQLYFNFEGAVTTLEIMVEDPDSIWRYRTPIIEAAGASRVFDWQQNNSAFFGALQVERFMMFIIVTLIVVVASFNIISGLTMFVKDKGHDIAILRTIGATRGAVLRIFFLAGSSLGFTGTFSGLILGALFCWKIEAIRQFFQWLTGLKLFPEEIYFLTRLPAKMDPGEVGTVMLISLGISFIATLYPAWRAARLDPVEALRYE